MSIRGRHRSVWTRWYLCAALGVVALWCPPSVAADLLVTGEGESLSGNLSRIADGIVIFRTSLKGQMMLPVSEVRSLTTEGRWIVTLNGGNVHIGQFARGGIATDGPAGRDNAVVPVEYSALLSAKQAPPIANENVWRQRAAIGAQAHWGSRDRVAPFVQWELDGDGPEGSVGLRMRFDLRDDGLPSDTAFADVELVPGAQSSWRPFLRASFARDTHEALSWRTGLTVGLRYDFTPGASSETSAYLGVAGAYSRWRAYDDMPWHGRRLSEGDGALGLQVGLTHARPVWGAGAWESRINLAPGTAPRSDFRAEAETSLSYPLTPRLQLRFDVLVGYEEEPVFATLESLGANVGASLQFDF